MTKGVTLELNYWNGKVGRCENDHIVSVGTNGYGFCVECASEVPGYSTLYTASLKPGPQPLEHEE